MNGERFRVGRMDERNTLFNSIPDGNFRRAPFGVTDNSAIRLALLAQGGPSLQANKRKFNHRGHRELRERSKRFSLGESFGKNQGLKLCVLRVLCGKSSGSLFN
jgi:hypothetical protein